jgi:putative endonuclease
LAGHLKYDNKHIIKGKVGENLAFDFLLNAGYDIQAINWREGKAEIDLIAMINNTLVFIEVKTRASELHPELAVTYRKQKLIISAANKYIDSVNWEGEIRFDIIAITHKSNKEFTLNHYIDAFFPGLGF